MFEFVERNRFFVKLLLGTVILGLALGVGVTSYNVFTEPALAKVGNVSITEQDVLEATDGQNVSMQEKWQVLSQLVQRQVLLNSADDLHIGASEKALQYVLNNMPQFAENGQFSAELYQSFLKKHQLTDQQYRKDLAQGIRMRALLAPIQESSFVSQTMIQHLLPALLEKRAVSVARFLPSTELGAAVVSDKDVKNDYEKHKKEFQLPERVRVAYLVLAEQGLAQTIEVSDKEVSDYEKGHHRDDLEERRARHILFQVPKNADAKTKAQIKDRAVVVWTQLRENPKKFAEVARLYSEDMGSAKAGGDLGFFKRGMMVPAFEEAVFALRPGQIGDVVETSFGFHIIQLEAIREPSTSALKDEAIAAIKKQKANRQFLAQRAKLAEALPMAEDLESVAKSTQLGVQVSDWLNKNTAKEPVLNHDAVREAIFAADVLSGEYNTDLIEVQPGVLVAARVIEKQPSRQQTLEEVWPAILFKLRLEQAQILAEKKGKKALADLQAGRPVKLAWANEEKLSRTNPMLPPSYADVVRQVFRVKKDALPAYIGAKLPSRPGTESEYVILRVTKIIPPEIQAVTQEKKDISEFYAQLELGRYFDYLYNNVSVDFSGTKKQ